MQLVPANLNVSGIEELGRLLPFVFPEVPRLINRAIGSAKQDHGFGQSKVVETQVLVSLSMSP